MSSFWMSALGYVFEPTPTGFASWEDYWRDVGVPESELGIGLDSIVGPSGRRPRIWFQVVDEMKVTKNRLHLDLGASGGRSFPIEVRKQRVEAEAARFGKLGATRVGVTSDGTEIDHYGVAMNDPEGNEFDIN